MANPALTLRSRHRAKGLILALSCAVTLALHGCGGGGSGDESSPHRTASAPAADTMEAFARQRLRWHTCPADVTGSFPADTASRLQCADMKVPLDYRRPEAGMASMALSRIAPASGGAPGTPGTPAARRGTLVFNPGGPGGDGLLLPLYFSTLWSAANPDTAAGTALRRLAAEFDLVGFSPRGVGGSTQLVCSSNRTLRTVGNASYDRTADKIATLVEDARLIAQACLSHPLVGHFNTETTAHDLELMRRVLGVPTISYYGYSYGTWLGKWFESLYPASVDRMVLDSTMAFPGSFDDNLAHQLMGRQRVLDEVLAPAIAVRNADFGMGTMPEQVRMEIRRWHPLVQALVDRTLPYADSRAFEYALLLLRAAHGLDGIVASTPTPVTGAALAEAVATHAFSPDPHQNDSLRWAAGQLAAGWDALQQEPTEPILLTPLYSLNRAVVCNDTDSNPDPAFWIARGNDFARRYPYLGGSVTANPCMFWGGARVRKPAGDSAARLLLVQDEFDPLTVREGAQATFATLPNASMVFVRGEYAHGVFPYGSACVDKPVADYLLGLPPASRRIECPGNRLPDPVARSGVAAKALPVAAAAAVYGSDPASLRALEGIRSTLQRSALDPRRP